MEILLKHLEENLPDNFLTSPMGANVVLWGYSPKDDDRVPKAITINIKLPEFWDAEAAEYLYSISSYKKDKSLQRYIEWLVEAANKANLRCFIVCYHEDVSNEFYVIENGSGRIYAPREFRELMHEILEVDPEDKLYGKKYGKDPFMAWTKWNFPVNVYRFYLKGVLLANDGSAYLLEVKGSDILDTWLPYLNDAFQFKFHLRFANALGIPSLTFIHQHGALRELCWLDVNSINEKKLTFFRDHDIIAGHYMKYNELHMYLTLKQFEDVLYKKLGVTPRVEVPEEERVYANG